MGSGACGNTTRGQANYDRVLRCFGDVCCLRSLLTLNDLELDGVAFLEALVAGGGDGTIVNEHIGAAIASDESVSLCIVKPLHRSLQSFHVRPLSQASFTRT